MAALSVRLPDDLDRELTEQARRANKRRSDLVREAVRDYVQRQAHQRFMDDLVAEMRAWQGFASARRDSDALTTDASDDDIDTLIVSEHKAGTVPDAPWWK